MDVTGGIGGSPDGGACVYILGEPAPGGQLSFCAAPSQPGSPYCPHHHRLCHLPAGSAPADRQLDAIEALATAVGSRQPRRARLPPPLLRRLESIERAFSRPRRSRIVLEKQMNKSHAQPTPAHADEPGPTPERRRHGPIERLECAIGDSEGRPSRPFRAVDTLAIMQRRGTITPGMRQAGEDFRARFAQAQLDPLRALDMSHRRLGERSLRPNGEGPALRIEAARASVWRAVQAVGGIASPAGSCLWHVLGWERSVKEWALGQGWSGRRVSQEAASGILVAALGALEAYYSLKR